MGRPKGSGSTYHPDVADHIVEELAQGVFLTVICAGPVPDHLTQHLPDGMPRPNTVYGWKEDHPDFRERFERARSIGYLAIAEDTVKIADTPLMGVEEAFEENEAVAKNGQVYTLARRRQQRSEMLGHRRLQVETRLKVLAILDPDRFVPNTRRGEKDDGEGTQVKVEGGLPDEE